MKILATADWHISRKALEEVKKCLVFLVETARTEAVDLTVIAADVFDSQEVKVDSEEARLAFEIISQLADISPVAIVTGTPSHEGKAPFLFSFIKGKYNVSASYFPEQLYLSTEGNFYRSWISRVEQPLAVLTMIPTPTKQFFQTASDISGADQEIGQAMSGLFAGFGAQAADYRAPHILVGHFNVAGSTLSNGQVRTGMDIEVGRDQIAMAGADVVALGHIHLPQEFYPGSIYAVNVGEDHPHGFKIYDLVRGADGAWMTGERFINTPCKQIARFKYDIDGGITGTPIEDIKGATVRVDIEAWQDEAGAVDKKGMAENYLALGALSVDIHITAVPRENVRAEAVLKAGRLRDKIQARAVINGDELAPETLEMADLLEDTAADELLRMVAL